MTNDYKLTKFIESMLSNRRFFVEFQDKRSRWRLQRNGLPQGSVLAPLLFNIYTNDQPVGPHTRSFLYADDLELIAQGAKFEDVERKLHSALNDLGRYYKKNQLRANPSKTLTCAFHLRNREANRKIHLNWCGINLVHTENPRYLGVILYRTFSFKAHCLSINQNVSSRNNLLKKLISTKWVAHAATLRTSALALCYSSAEYASPVWCRSA